jgi:serine/threonine protein kinase/tetratricopeptide (TPR) repeat protein
MVTASCPSREMLLQYSIGMLSDEQSDGLAGHLDSCPDCQATIMTLEDAEDTLIGRLRMPLGSEACLAEPEFQAALAHAIAMPAAAPSGAGVSPVPPGGESNPASVMPQMLGEYQILEELGHGGMGRVYKALHTKLDRVVAIKVLPRGRLEDPQAIARFEREMRAVGRLAHPNIVQAHDAREIDGTPVLVMEFVDGLDLAELVRRVGPLPVAEACELVRQTALGLQRAHEHGLVHRDIKPSNLMLALSGQPSVFSHQRPAVGDSAPRPSSVAPPQVKILDLGLALLKAHEPAGEGATDSEGGTGVSAVPPVATAPGEELTGAQQGQTVAEELTGAQQVMGTVSYMAPEQAGDAHQVDIRADIYSLGCTLYKLLSGHAPGGLAPATHHPPPATQVRPIRQLRPDVPDALAAVLDRMLAKDPADRFATPAEVAEALEPFAATSDLASLTGGLSQFSRSENGTVPFPQRTVPFWRRTRPRRLALAAGAAAAAILLGILFTVSTGKGTVQLEFADAEAARQCTISIDGDELRIENLGEPIKLRPGKHQLRILHGDLEIETREFDVVRSGKQVLHVSIPTRHGEIVAAAPGGAKKPAGSEQAEQVGKRAYDYAQRGEYGKAASEYSKAIQLDPDHAGWWVLRAVAELADGQVGVYRQHCAEMLRHFGQRQNLARAACYDICLACCLRPDAVADFSAALAVAERALEDAIPENGAYLFARGALLYRAGRIDEAIADLNRAHDSLRGRAGTNPWVMLDDAKVCSFLAMANHRLGHHDDARKSFATMVEQTERAIQDERSGKPWCYSYWSNRLPPRLLADEARALLKVDADQAHAARGRAHYDKGEFSEAIAAYTEAIRLEPKNTAHYVGRGEAYAEKGDFEKALADCREALRLDAACGRAYFCQGILSFAAGKTDLYRSTAKAMLAHIALSQSGSEQVSWICALGPDAVADLPKAVAWGEGAQKQFPKSPWRHYALGMVLYRSGRFEESLQHLTEAIRLSPPEPREQGWECSPAEVWYFLAMAHYRLGHAEEARKWLDKADRWTDKAFAEDESGAGYRYHWYRRLPLKLFRAEAAQLLGIGDKPPTAKEKAEKRR